MRCQINSSLEKNTLSHSWTKKLKTSHDNLSNMVHQYFKETKGLPSSVLDHQVMDSLDSLKYVFSKLGYLVKRYIEKISLKSVAPYF